MTPRVYKIGDPSIPPDAVYVGRGTPWGNPFVMESSRHRNYVCDRFEQEILPTLDVSALRGKSLVCHCAPLRCHADALLRAANPPEAELFDRP